MSQQVPAVCGSCIGTLRKLHRLGPLLYPTTLHSVVLVMVISRLDYRNALYAGITSQLMHCLQTIQNDATRLIFKVPRSTSASPLLRKLHWLPIAQRVTFKVMCLAHKIAFSLLSGPLENRCTITLHSGRYVQPRPDSWSLHGTCFFYLGPQILEPPSPSS